MQVEEALGQQAPHKGGMSETLLPSTDQVLLYLLAFAGNILKGLGSLSQAFIQLATIELAHSITAALAYPTLRVVA